MVRTNRLRESTQRVWRDKSSSARRRGADEAAGLICKVIQWRIEYAQHTLALAKELDLDETAGAIQQCIDTYARERDKRKEAGTWEQAK